MTTMLIVLLVLIPASSAHDTLKLLPGPGVNNGAAAPSNIIVHPAGEGEGAGEGAGAAAASSSTTTEEEKNKDEEEEKKKKNEEEKKEREKKELEEIEKLKLEAKGLVSFTNGTGLYKGMSREFIVGHNIVRQRYGVPPMKWNNKLARQARRWSNAMRKDCQLKHSVGNNYGESIFVSPKGSGWNATAKDALWSWTKEESIYDKLTGNCTGGRHFNDCGHFSIMVNQKNQKIGCGRAECYRGGVFMACNYFLRDHDP